MIAFLIPGWKVKLLICLYRMLADSATGRHVGDSGFVLDHPRGNRSGGNAIAAIPKKVPSLPSTSVRAGLSSTREARHPPGRGDKVRGTTRGGHQWKAKPRAKSHCRR